MLNTATGIIFHERLVMVLVSLLCVQACVWGGGGGGGGMSGGRFLYMYSSLEKKKKKKGKEILRKPFG